MLDIVSIVLSGSLNLKCLYHVRSYVDIQT